MSLHTGRLCSIRKPRWTLLLAFLMYSTLVALNVSKESRDDKDLKAIHRILEQETRGFLSSIPKTLKPPAAAVELQNTLNCGVQERKKWTGNHKLNTTCFPHAPSHDIMPNAATRICDHLAGKRIVFVGPLTTYHIHNLWLEALEAHEGHSLTCPGPEYCIFHHICYPGRNWSYWDVDRQRFPKNQELRDTKSAVLQYVLSSSLVAHRDKDDYLYSRPVMDPRTNIRMRNYYWLRKAQKAHILVLGQAPVPAPPATYAQHFKRGHSGSMLPTPWKALALREELVSLALNATLSVFLPSLRDAMLAIQSDSQIRNTLKVWHGHWALDPECTNSGLPKHVPRLHQFWDPDRLYVDPWTFYYNLQGAMKDGHLIPVSNDVILVYIQDLILPVILYHFNVSYMPISLPSGETRPHVAQDPYARKDCARTLEKQLEVVFTSGLSRMLNGENPSPQYD